jgi:hypothetical protein
MLVLLLLLLGWQQQASWPWLQQPLPPAAAPAAAPAPWLRGFAARLLP